MLAAVKSRSGPPSDDPEHEQAETYLSEAWQLCWTGAKQNSEYAPDPLSFGDVNANFFEDEF